MLLAEGLEVLLVEGGLVLELADLLDLVVVDSERLVIDRQVLLGRGGLIWLLEANESIELLLLVGRVHLEALDFTILLEKVTKLVLGHIVGEALHVKVAALLGRLVLDGLAEALSLTVNLFQGLLNVESLVVWEGLAVDVVNAVEFSNGLGSALGSILTVLAVLRVVADESKGAFGVRNELHALNASKLGEQVAHFILSETLWEVLGVDVVEDLAEVALVTGLVLDDLAGVGGRIGFEGLGSAA